MLSSLELSVDSSPLLAAIESLKESAERIPGVAECLSDLLLENGETLREGLVELRGVSTTGASGLAVSFDLSERFCEIVAAARAGDVDLLRSYRVVDVHGGTCA